MIRFKKHVSLTKNVMRELVVTLIILSVNTAVCVFLVLIWGWRTIDQNRESYLHSPIPFPFTAFDSRIFWMKIEDEEHRFAGFRRSRIRNVIPECPPPAGVCVFLSSVQIKMKFSGSTRLDEVMGWNLWAGEPRLI